MGKRRASILAMTMLFALVALLEMLASAPKASAATQKLASEQCRMIAKELVNYVDEDSGRRLVFQLAHNKSRWEKIGHYSLGAGVLSEYPANNSYARNLPSDGKAVWFPGEHYIMRSIVDADLGSIPRGDSFPTSRRDKLVLYLSENGTMGVILASWGNGFVPFESLNCFKDTFGYYMSGVYREGNGTTLVSVVMRKVDL